MTKRHWISAPLGRSGPGGLSRELIRESCDLVVAALPPANGMASEPANSGPGGRVGHIHPLTDVLS
jgi:hypothetical protein